MRETLEKIQAIVEREGTMNYADMLNELEFDERRSALFIMKRMERAGILHRELVRGQDGHTVVLHAGPREAGDE